MDAEDFLKDETIRYWRPFTWHYKTSVDENGWSVAAMVTLPEIDEEKIVPKEKAIAQLLLKREGSFTQIIEPTRHILNRQIIGKKGISNPVGPTIVLEMEKLLVESVETDPGEALHWLVNRQEWKRGDTRSRIEMAKFFLRLPKIRELELFYWRNWQEILDASSFERGIVAALEQITAGRKEKSIRRVLFQSYENSIRQKSYDPRPDWIFCRHIKDPNHLKKLIGMDTRVKSRLFDDLLFDEAEELTEKILDLYGERGSARFWLSVEGGHLDNRYIRDIHRLLRVMGRNQRMHRDFRRPAACIEKLHNELVRISGAFQRKKEWAISFEYAPEVLRLEKNIGDFQLRLPKSGEELARWGAWLENCLVSYILEVASGKSVILGVFENDELRYALELAEGKIVQFSGLRNSRVPFEIKKVIENYLN
ncbi:PcfJ domain-containing protein [Nitratifractor salsuginis]|nr:PcfJ domain-containing protein [Nitratifractor salsuginis]